MTPDPLVTETEKKEKDKKSRDVKKFSNRNKKLSVLPSHSTKIKEIKE